MKNKCQGYSIFEIIIGIGVLITLSPFIFNFYVSSEKSQQASLLADSTKAYANAYNEYIKQNYKILVDNSADTPGQIYALKYDDVKNSIGFSNIKTSSSNLAPCLVYRYNNGGEIRAMLFFTKQKTSKTLDKIIAAKTAIQIGAGGGYIENGQVNGGDYWGLPANDPMLVAATSLCGGQVPQYSPVVNLSIRNNYPNPGNTTDPYLSRFQDNKAPVGEQANENTMQTDLYLSYKSPDNPSNLKPNALYLKGNENNSEQDKVYIVSSNASDVIGTNNYPRVNKLGNAAYINSGVVVDYIKPHGEKQLYETCKSEELGTIVLQNPNTSGDLPIVGTLQCTRSRLQCNNGDEYCYTPVNDLSIAYHPNIPSFTCPIGYLNDNIQATAASSIDYKPAAYGASCRRCNWTGYCWRTYEGRGCEWKAINSVITKIDKFNDERDYKVYSGVYAQTTWEAYNNADGDCGCGGTQVTEGLVTSVTCTTANPVINVTN